MISASVIGQRIKNLRESKGMTQEAFCNAVGITQPALSNYETGLRIPRDEVKLRIARCFDTSIEAIFYAD